MAGEDRSELEEAFMAACSDARRAEKFEMTEDEQKSFVKAMKDPEFRSLLNEYMLEISDPANRAEQEMYLRQLERENQVPSDKQLVIPTAGFVLKVKHKAKKLFVNVCTSEKIQPPSSTRVKQTQNDATGTSWNLPYCVGPHRMEQDKGGQAVMTFDVCYHPQTLVQAKQSAAFLKMLVNTALDGVDLALSKIEANEPKVNRDYHILKGITYKSGDPITMVISTPKQSDNSQKDAKASNVKSKSNTKSDISKVASSESKPKSQEASVSAMPKMQEIKYQIVQRGQFDIADHMENGEKKLFRPRELLVKMDFPSQTSAVGIDLDVSSKQVKVNAKDYSAICIDLPFPVVEAKGSAKFDKATRKLIVTLPVVEEPRTKREVNTCVAQDSVDEAKEEELVSQPHAATELQLVNASTEKQRVKEPKREVPSDEFAPYREFALMSKHDKPKISYINPKVVVQETESHKSYILQVAGIIATSISVMELTDATHVTFQSSNGSWYQFDFATVGILEWTHDLASENMAIICAKFHSKLNPESSVATSSTDITHDAPHRIDMDTTTISLIVDVADIETSSVQANFTSSIVSVVFHTKHNIKYNLKKSLDHPVDPESSKVVNVADDNMLIVLPLANEQACHDDIPTEAVSADTKAAIVKSFTNDVMYELD